jgi:hypothetical protein
MSWKCDETQRLFSAIFPESTLIYRYYGAIVLMKTRLNPAIVCTSSAVHDVATDFNGGPSMAGRI